MFLRKLLLFFLVFSMLFSTSMNVLILQPDLSLLILFFLVVTLYKCIIYNVGCTLLQFIPDILNCSFLWYTLYK